MNKTEASAAPLSVRSNDELGDKQRYENALKTIWDRYLNGDNVSAGTLAYIAKDALSPNV